MRHAVHATNRVNNCIPVSGQVSPAIQLKASDGGITGGTYSVYSVDSGKPKDGESAATADAKLPAMNIGVEMHWSLGGEQRQRIGEGPGIFSNRGRALPCRTDLTGDRDRRQLQR